MEFGVTGRLAGGYPAESYRKNASAGRAEGVRFGELASAGKAEGVSFRELASAGRVEGVRFSELALSCRTEGASFRGLASARAAGQECVSEISFQDLWQTRFPGAYYHTADASKIPQGVWERNDFPFEKFFREDLDESAMNWRPNGADPAMDSTGVQSRLHAIAGQKSIVVPPELEEKMKHDPELARQVMAKAESFIAANQVPGRICSHLIVLDENGDCPFPGIQPWRQYYWPDRGRNAPVRGGAGGQEETEGGICPAECGKRLETQAVGTGSG